MTQSATKRTLTMAHWGAYQIDVNADRITHVQGLDTDPEPSIIGRSFIDSIHHRSRITQPMVRRGWLEKGPLDHGGGRGDDQFVEVSWDVALDLVAAELDRVKARHGNEAIFAGSYGWASAGRFHHAQSQIHRFLKQFGGYAYSVNTYSTAAAQNIIPHVFGMDFMNMLDNMTAWPVIAEHTKLVVAFGGLPLKNSQINAGGIGKHNTREFLNLARRNGAEFVNIGPLEEDIDTSLDPQWVAVRPNTDTALMLAIAHTLVSEGLHDEGFLTSYCTGFDRFLPYLTGTDDGQPKDADWAASICDIPAKAIRDLARRMSSTRCMITVSWSLQRADHGEQPFWMAGVLAAMLGQIGLPGGGIGYGYVGDSGIGHPVRRLSGPTLPQGNNPVQAHIPVARICDMLLNPGGTFEFNGQTMTYPDARVVYWCGGNPFHHHQDINNLVEAWQRPETVIVHEPWWNSVARHADIVLPATTTLERNDIGRASNDSLILAMQKAVEPVGDARNDYDIFSGIAERLGFADQFTEGRDEMAWLSHLYDVFRQKITNESIELPAFEDFWHAGMLELPTDDPDRILFREFRENPTKFPLKTPSGKIEIFSETIDGFHYDDCPGHPAWLEPAEWLGGETASDYSFHLISNQPTTRLHSQLDFGITSTSDKIQGREPVYLNPADAAARDIEEGDVVRLFNGRGACLAGARIRDSVRRSVAVIATGAWYDPEVPRGLDLHGNPNVLTLDKGTSRLAQGPSAHTTLIAIEKFDRVAPRVRIFEPPEIISQYENATGS